jgi:hypothetical protein
MPINQAERDRRRALLKAHIDAENRGDMDAVMRTFSADAVMHYNATPFPTGDAIAAAHAYLGFSQAPGAFKNPVNVVDRESFTDTDIVVEGRLCAVHQGEFLGFKATGRAVELPFTAIYCFGDDGKLTSERVVMNLGPLHDGFFPAPAGLV